MAKKGNWALAEEIGNGITLISTRQQNWSEIAESTYEKEGNEKSFLLGNKLKDEESRYFYMKGWANKLKFSDSKEQIIYKALPVLIHDLAIIELLMYKYAIHEIFFNSNFAIIKRINRIVNVQWAIDIAAKFNKSEFVEKYSTNIDEWLKFISDEDDQEQILLWSRQVAKGKLTEEQFRANVSRFVNIL